MTTLGGRHRLCAVDDLAPGTAKRFDIDGHRIALVRCAAAFYAIGDRCTHADISLAEGDVLCDEHAIECWKHGSTFSLVDGEPRSLPATRATPVYPVTVEGDDVLVELP